jgi:hypothetical protein
MVQKAQSVVGTSYSFKLSPNISKNRAEVNQRRHFQVAFSRLIAYIVSEIYPKSTTFLQEQE